MQTFPEVFRSLPMVFLSLAVLASLRAFVLNAPLPLKMLSGLLIFSFIVETVGLYLRILTPEDKVYQFLYGSDSAGEITQNQWLYNIYNFIAIIMLARIFYYQLSSDNLKVVIQFFYPLFTVFFLWNSFFNQGMLAYQTLTFVAGGSFVMFLSGAYFWELLISSDNEKITQDPFFWFSFGLIVCYGGTIPFHGMFNYLRSNFFDFTVFYYTFISNGFSIFLNILIIIGYLCRKNFQKSSSYS